MCTVNNSTYTLKKARTVYKVVRKTSNRQYVSQFLQGERKSLKGEASRGNVLVYTPGATIKSPSGPGIMAYLRRCYAAAAVSYGDVERVLELRIPAGTKIRYGNWGLRIICAAKVKVVGVCHEEAA